MHDSALTIHLRVMNALIMRDIRTRFFGHGLGYLIAIAWPLFHISILLTVYYVLGRIAPVGDSLALYFATGLVPFMSFSYSSRWIMVSVATNRVLLNFPLVRIVDIVLARAALEASAAVCMALVLMAVLSVLGVDVVPSDPAGAASAMASAIYLGFGMGFANAIIAMALPGWMLGYALIIMILYASSGILWSVHNLPEALVGYVLYNPIVHCVEWMRSSFYYNYPTGLLDKSYIWEFGTGALFFGLLIERVFRDKLLGG